jgi:peptidoglycan/LPS O-acetylase OafA/YrhL
LMPLYLFSCAIWLLLIDRTPLINGNAWQQIGAYVFMLQHWFDATRGSINPVTWTLSVEVHHYLMVFLAVMLLLPNMQQRRWLVAALICGVLYSVAFRYGVFVRFPDEAGKVRWTLIASGMFDAFAIGGLIAVAHQAGTLERLHRHQSLLWCVWIVLATILIAAIHSAGMNASGQRDGAAYWASAWFAVGFRFALACVCGLLLVLMLQFRATGAVARALVYLGAISYGIYLWHFFALKLLDRYQLGGAVAAVVGVAATLMVAHLSYRFIETPVNQWTRRRALLVR